MYIYIQVDWSQYRGILDAPGNTNAWGLFWRLASGSAVFKIDGEYSNAYIKQLRPWVHYIPISNNLSDLIPLSKNIYKIELLEKIALEARKFVMNYTFEKEITRVASELTYIWNITKNSN